MGTVVSPGAAPLASALLERLVDGRRPTRRRTLAAGLGLPGTVLLRVAEAAGGAGRAATLPGVGPGSPS